MLAYLYCISAVTLQTAFSPYSREERCIDKVGNNVALRGVANVMRIIHIRVLSNLKNTGLASVTT